MKSLNLRSSLTSLPLRVGIWCVASLILTAGFAQAQNRLWPTHVQWENNACVSSETVWTKPSEFSRGVEVGRCTTARASNQEKKAICIKAGDSKGVGFFTEQCSLTFSVSVNGVEHSLKKWVPKLNRFVSHEELTDLRFKGGAPLSANQPELVGRFEGEGVKLRVFNPKLIERETDETAGPGDDPVLSETFRVQVELSMGNMKKRFPATLFVEHK